MNKEEYFISETYRKNFEYLSVQKMLQEWKSNNNLSKKCVVHHRDDTEECRRYNEEHYELWGFNLDGTFEYGKYVVFMTCADHARHHQTGKHHSNETRKKLRDARIGTHPSIETRKKMREAQLGKLNHFYGKTHSEETRKKLRDVNIGRHHTDETKAKMSEQRKGVLNVMYGKHHTAEAKRCISEIKKVQMAEKCKLYHTYIANGGLLKWNDFLSALKNRDSEVGRLIGNN